MTARALPVHYPEIGNTLYRGRRNLVAREDCICGRSPRRKETASSRGLLGRNNRLRQHVRVLESTWGLSPMLRSREWMQRGKLHAAARTSLSIFKVSLRRG